MTITCPKCGKSVSSDYQFCPYCGAAINTFNTGNNGGFNNQGNTGFPPQPDFDNRSQQTQQQNQNQSGWPFPFPGQNNNQNSGGTTGGNVQNPFGNGKALGCIIPVASFIIPIVGIVVYFMYRKKDMAYAKKMLYIALAGIAFNLIVNVIGRGSQYSYFHNLMGGY